MAISFRLTVLFRVRFSVAVRVRGRDRAWGQYRLHL